MTLVAGSTIGPYRIIERLGAGGMASVHKAYQASLGRHVAIKVLPAFFAEDPGFRERFRQEALAVAQLRHPNILAIFDYGEEAGAHYIVGEFVSGGTLAQQLGAPMSVTRAVAILRPIAAALDHAHQRGMVHRDVKPSNVLIAADGTPILADFGLATMTGNVPRLTQTGTTIGTPEYMSPEAAGGAQAGPLSDQYALGVIAYEMLTGRVPFTADTPLAVLLAHAHAPLPLPRTVEPSIPEPVEEVLLKVLAKSPDDRFPDCAHFVAALEQAAPAPATEPVGLTQAPVASTGPVSVPAVAPPPRALFPPKALVIGLGLVAIVVAAVGGGLAIRSSAPGAPAASAPIDAAKGALIFEAKLDGSRDDIRSVSGPDSSNVRFAKGAIEIPTTKQGSTGVGFNTVPLDSYVGEFELELLPGTRTGFLTVGIRRARTTSYPGYFCAINVASEKVYAYFQQSESTEMSDLTPRATVSGLQEGRRFAIGTSVIGGRYALRLDGREVGRFEDARFTATTYIEVFFYNPGGSSGGVRIVSARIYRPQ